MPSIHSRYNQPQPKRENGLGLLCFDAGGARVISQLKMLAEVMHRWKVKTRTDSDRDVPPYEVFDVIGGIGIGGFAAILLVVFGMTAQQALSYLQQLSKDIFGNDQWDQNQRTNELEIIAVQLLAEHGFSQEANLLDAARSRECTLIVPIAHRENTQRLSILPSYESRNSLLKMTVLQAILATCADIQSFNSVSISYNGVTQEFVNGAIALPNPINELVAEAHARFEPDTRVACILSIGMGYSRVPSVSTKLTPSSELELLRDVLSDGERRAQEYMARLAHIPVYFRLSVQQGFQNMPTQAWHEIESILSHTQSFLQDANVDMMIDKGVEALAVHNGPVTLEQLHHAGGGIFEPIPLPPITRNFVDRPKPMEELVDKLSGNIGNQEQRIVVLSGLGGCGKTTLALKYIKDFSSQYRSTFFVECMTPNKIRSALTRHVRSLDVLYSQYSFEEALNFLSQPIEGKRLIVYDNADDPNIKLEDFIPYCPNVSIIITTRNPTLSYLSPNSLIELDTMSVSEAVQLLLLTSKQAKDQVDLEIEPRIAEALGYYPVALVQAGGYVAQTKKSWKDYLRVYSESRRHLMDKEAMYRIGMRYSSLYAAFDASYKALPPQAQQCLHLLSFFNRRNFPLDLIYSASKSGFTYEGYHYLDTDQAFNRGVEKLKEIFYSEGEWNEIHLDSIIETLQAFSLITVTETSYTGLIHVHPLIHNWTKDRLPDEQVESYTLATIRLLSCGSHYGVGFINQHLASHVHHVAPLWKQQHVNDKYGFEVVLNHSSDYSSAATLARDVFESVKESLPVDDERVIHAKKQLAAMCWRLGQWTEAVELEEEILKSLKEIKGDRYPDTIEASVFLASTYNSLKRFEEASKLMEEVLKCQREKLGCRDIATIRASASLASAYHSLKKFKEALELRENVLEQLTDMLGEHHLDTISASAELASTYRSLRRFDDALELNLEVLNQRTKQLGEGHRDTIQASADLGSTYRYLGQLEKSLKLNETVLKQLREQLGDQHLDTIWASATLASTYHSLRRFDDALRLNEDALERQRKQLGNEHLYTIEALSRLAGTYYLMKRFDKALELNEEVLERRRKLLGDQHLGTIDALSNVASVYYSMRQFDEALKRYEEVLKQRRELLGEKHLDTIDALSNVASVYYSMRRFDEALGLNQEVLELRRELLGDKHFDTIDALSNVASVYYSMRRFNEALRLNEEILERRRELLGEKNLDTINALSNVASVCCSMRRFDEALELNQKVLEQRRELLGEKHLDTIDALSNVASTHFSMKQFEEALQWNKELLKRRRELLGDQHLDTIDALSKVAFTHSSMKQFEEALKWNEEVLKHKRELFGDCHLEMIQTLVRLASTYSSLKRHREEKRMREEILEIKRKILGPQHPSTIEAMDQLTWTCRKTGNHLEARRLSYEIKRLKG